MQASRNQEAETATAAVAEEEVVVEEQEQEGEGEEKVVDCDEGKPPFLPNAPATGPRERSSRRRSRAAPAHSIPAAPPLQHNFCTRIMHF